MHHSIKTMKVLAAFAGFLVIAFLLANCKKEYSYEGGTAVFTLLSINGHCTNPVVSGDYVAGSTLGSSNTVQLQVEVTATGKFSLQTNNLNGFRSQQPVLFLTPGFRRLFLLQQASQLLPVFSVLLRN